MPFNLPSALLQYMLNLLKSFTACFSVSVGSLELLREPVDSLELLREPGVESLELLREPGVDSLELLREPVDSLELLRECILL